MSSVQLGGEAKTCDGALAVIATQWKTSVERGRSPSVTVAEDEDEHEHEHASVKNVDERTNDLHLNSIFPLEIPMQSFSSDSRINRDNIAGNGQRQVSKHNIRMHCVSRGTVRRELLGGRRSWLRAAWRWTFPSMRELLLATVVVQDPEDRPTPHRPHPSPATMSVAALSKSLPKPKYTGEEEELTRSTRVLSSEQYETQVARRQNGPPPYGSRQSWRPRTAEDFGDGGAFPEVHVAQYPLDMGKKGQPSTSNALTRRVDAEGKTKYDEIARRGHGESRIVQASFKDLIPLRQQANAGELDLDRPSQEVVQATKQKTEAALMALVSGQTAAQRPKNVQGRKDDEPTFVRYTPTAQMGEAQGDSSIPWSHRNSSTSAFPAAHLRPRPQSSTRRRES
jgi:hypothetical protein